VGRTLLWYEEADSTNTVAMTAARAGAEEGTVVVAESQTAGRGRYGRTWYSPKGTNLYFSVILRPVLLPTQADLLNHLSVAACCETLRETTGLEVRIKWPNDLVVHEKKLGGILTEILTDAASTVPSIRAAVIGIGINVNQPQEAFLPELQSIATSVLAEREQPTDRDRLIAEILNRIETRYRALLAEGPAPLLSVCRALSDTLNRAVTVETPRGPVAGLAVGLTETGALLLMREDGTMATIPIGEILHLR
jgi:BirA family biotin operon repressor/biotin-[acetyl-CoA-carboxylase] ligase